MKGKIEVILVGVMGLIFLIWAANKCSSGKTEAQEKAATEAREDSILNAQKNPAQTSALPAITTSPPASSTATPVAGQTAAVTPAPTAGNAAAPATTQPAATTTAAQTAAAKPTESQGGTRLWVTIDKLKVRKQPGLKGDVLGELKLFDEVYFMNEETDSTFEVNLGKEIANEPYVKIKTKKGTIGWVYGAGVHYAKKKRTGTLE